MNEIPLPFLTADDPLLAQLDRAASILRNYSDDDGALTLTDDECSYLSTLLGTAANAIADERRRRTGQ